MISSRSTFRPRPIDVNRPIPIRFEQEDETEVDAELLKRTLPRVNTGIEGEEEEEAHIKHVLDSSQVRIEADIPTPVVRDTSGYAEMQKPDFVAPVSYIRTAIRTPLEEFRLVEYDLDDKDFAWLEQYNKSAAVAAERLSEDQLEVLIDRFEKKTADSEELIPLHVVAETLSFGSLNLKVLLQAIAPPALHAAYAHWTARRKAAGHALLERFRPPPRHDDPSPLVAFRPRDHEKKLVRKASRRAEKQTIAKLGQLRLSLEKARALLDAVKKRERLKKEYLTVLAAIFEQKYIDIRRRAHQSDLDASLPLGSAASMAGYPGLSSLSAAASSSKGQRYKRQKIAGGAAKRRDVRDWSSDSENEWSSSDDSASDQLAMHHHHHHHHHPHHMLLLPTTSPAAHCSDAVDPSAAAAAQSKARKYPQLRDPFAPDRYGHKLYVSSQCEPFRGRLRVGRGGRILFDRHSIPAKEQLPISVLPTWVHRATPSASSSHKQFSSASEPAKSTSIGPSASPPSASSALSFDSLSSSLSSNTQFSSPSSTPSLSQSSSSSSSSSSVLQAADRKSSSAVLVDDDDDDESRFAAMFRVGQKHGDPLLPSSVFYQSPYFLPSNILRNISDADLSFISASEPIIADIQSLLSDNPYNPVVSDAFQPCSTPTYPLAHPVALPPYPYCSWADHYHAKQVLKQKADADLAPP